MQLNSFQTTQINTFLFLKCSSQLHMNSFINLNFSHLPLLLSVVTTKVVTPKQTNKTTFKHLFKSRLKISHDFHNKKIFGQFFLMTDTIKVQSSQILTNIVKALLGQVQLGDVSWVMLVQLSDKLLFCVYWNFRSCINGFML